MGGKCAGAGRRAHSVSFVRPSGSAHRRSSESPSSGARLIGDDRAGRAYHRSWSHTEACRRTAARMRALRSTCRPMQWRRPPCEAGTRAVKKGGTKSLSENSSEKTILSMTAQSTARTCAVALRHSLDLRPVGSPLATYLCTYVIMPAPTRRSGLANARRRGCAQRRATAARRWRGCTRRSPPALHTGLGRPPHRGRLQPGIGRRA